MAAMSPADAGKNQAQADACANWAARERQRGTGLGEKIWYVRMFE